MNSAAIMLNKTKKHQICLPPCVSPICAQTDALNLEQSASVHSISSCEQQRALSVALYHMALHWRHGKFENVTFGYFEMQWCMYI